ALVHAETLTALLDELLTGRAGLDAELGEGSLRAAGLTDRERERVLPCGHLDLVLLELLGEVEFGVGVEELLTGATLVGLPGVAPAAFGCRAELVESLAELEATLERFGGGGKCVGAHGAS